MKHYKHMILALLIAVLFAGLIPAQAQGSTALPLKPNIGTTFPKKTFPTFTFTAVSGASMYKLRVIDDANILLLDMFVSPQSCVNGVCTVPSPMWFKRVGNFRWRVVTHFANGSTTEGPEEYFHIYPAFAVQMLFRVNQARCAQGMMPVALNLPLFKAAQRHSMDMANHNWFSHDGTDGTNPWVRISQAGYRGTATGENISAGQVFADDAFNAWMNSEGHRNNIMNPNATEMGIALIANNNSTYRYYWTQNFGYGNSGIPGRCP
jgi:hypothetical protein